MAKATGPGGSEGAKEEKDKTMPHSQPLQWSLERGPCRGVEGVAAGTGGYHKCLLVAAYLEALRRGIPGTSQEAKGEGQKEATRRAKQPEPGEAKEERRRGASPEPQAPGQGKDGTRLGVEGAAAGAGGCLRCLPVAVPLETF